MNKQHSPRDILTIPVAMNKKYLSQIILYINITMNTKSSWQAQSIQKCYYE